MVMFIQIGETAGIRGTGDSFKHTKRLDCDIVVREHDSRCKCICFTSNTDITDMIILQKYYSLH